MKSTEHIYDLKNQFYLGAANKRLGCDEAFRSGKKLEGEQAKASVSSTLFFLFLLLWFGFQGYRSCTGGSPKLFIIAAEKPLWRGNDLIGRKAQSSFWGVLRCACHQQPA